MNIEPANLYIRDNKDSIRIWTISVIDWDICIEYGVLGGSMQTQWEKVLEGKAGRTRNEQIMSRVSSRIHKRIDMGYSANIDDALKKPVNSLGLKKPMLAQPIKNVKNIDFSDAFIQHKYDGNRMLIANIGGENIAYSRNGKIVPGVRHILETIEMPEGTIIDGEIYCHGVPLQTIVSWVKREQENSLKLRYHAYDLIEDVPYKERYLMLKDVSFGEYAFRVPTMKVNNMEEINSLYYIMRNKGYEGAIVRWGNWGYEDGKRSKSLVKIKETLDDEFLVTSIIPSADEWAVLECIDPNKGITFKVSAPGCIKEKRKVLNNQQDYLGRYVRVEYMYLTKDKIPFHPVATGWIDPKDK